MNLNIKIAAIVAMDEGRAIGLNGDLPWYIPEDLKYFSRMTKGHAVLMGKNTWVSLKPQFKPLPNRLNIVCSRTPELIVAPKEVLRYDDPHKAINDARSAKLNLTSDTLWIVGGAQIYRETINEWDELYLTAIFSKFNGDTFFPEFEQDFNLVSSDDRLSCEQIPAYSFRRYVRKSSS